MAAMLASCSNDVTTAVNTTLNAPQEITFRTTADRMTRATATTTATITTNGFTAEAWKNSDHSAYFAATAFTNSGGSFVAASKPQWPDYNLDFIGWYPALDTYFAHSAWNTFTFVPNTTIASQTDYVIGAVLNQTKAVSGVPMIFKHLGSWIEVKVYNSKGNNTYNYKTTVSGWKIGYLYNGGVYTITGSTADASTLSTTGTWDYSTYAKADGSTVPTSYSETFTDVVMTNDGAYDTSGEALAVGNAMIIVPQETTKLTSSSTYDTNGHLAGAFIALKLLVEDATNDNDIADATTDNLWAVWPVNNDWVDGTKYTYIIDLSQGGYKETGTASATITPWIQNNEIFFNSVSVSAWTEGSPAVVTP